MKTKQKLIAHVGADFMADGERIFCFQLCTVKDRLPGVKAPRRLEAIVTLDYHDGELTRACFIPSIAGRAKAIEKLARKWMAKSTPVSF